MSVLIIFASLSLLIYSITQMSNAIEHSNQTIIKNILNKFTTNIFCCFLTGIFVCLITQSSSIITILTISLISSKVLSLNKGLAIVIGANIGTTLASLIITLNIGSFYFLFLLLGTLLFFLKKQTVGNVLIYLGLIFLSLDILENCLIAIFNNQIITTLLSKSINPFTGVLSGTIISFLIQSSSATIAVTQKMYMNHLISPLLGITIMLGANIGTTITGLIFSLNTSIDSKRLAIASLLFNIFGVLMFLPIVYIYKEELNLFSTTYLISLLHIYFNIITGIIGLFFIKPLCKLSSLIIK